MLVWIIKQNPTMSFSQTQSLKVKSWEKITGEYKSKKNNCSYINSRQNRV